MVKFFREVIMIVQPCMKENNPPFLTTMSLAADGHAILVKWTLRAWALIDAVTRGDLEFREGELDRRDDHVVLRIPVAHIRSPEWKQTAFALAKLRVAVDAFRGVDLSELQEGVSGQLLWIDALILRFGVADISVAASGEFASFIRGASPDVFRDVASIMRRAEQTIRGDAVGFGTRSVAEYAGALHMSVGSDCACFGVSAADRGYGETTGWEAHGHNLQSVDRVLLVLVALAALEDACRAAQTN